MECISTAILDSSEAQPLYLEAVDFMERQLGLTIPNGMREVPILAVDLPSLNEQRSNGISSSHTGQAVTRGLTLSTIGEIKHMSPGMLQWNPYDGSIIVHEPQVYRTEQVREVTAILVLFGLPRDLTASILAHEAMHAWMRLTHTMPHQLPPRVEEGLCQYIASKYLEGLEHEKDPSDPLKLGRQPSLTRSYSGGFKGESNRSNTDIAQAERKTRDATMKLRTYFRCQIETDESPIYGEGFRQAACCCSALGLDVVLDHVRETRDLPAV
jgi:hypothetical protein